MTLRAAVQEANTSGGSIYLPRGNYDLDISGTGGDAQGDLDINQDVIVVGAGPGATVITATNGDRHFDVSSTGTLGIERLTLTGSTFSGMGSSIYVDSQTPSSSNALTVNEAMAWPQ